MHHWHSSQIDLLVTPNHNMWLYDFNKRSPKTKCWKFIKSEDANNKAYKFAKSSNGLQNRGYDFFEIPCCKIQRGFYTQTYSSIKFEAAPFFEFLGWFVTDGSISYGKNSSGNRLSIAQVKQTGIKRIKLLLETLNINYTHYKKEIRINCPQLLLWLSENFLRQGDSHKTYYLKLPRWMSQTMSVKNIDDFLNGVIGGDGSQHTKGPGFQIYTCSLDFAKDIAELAMLANKAANIYMLQPRERIWTDGRKSQCKQKYIVSIVTTNDTLVRGDNIKRKESYNGYVYCVELPKYHKLYVMRNGKSCWCGNSHEIVRHRIAAYSQESTRYCNYSNSKFGNEITVIEPFFFKDNPERYELWKTAMEQAEATYFSLLKIGASPQEARSVLPNSLKTEIVVTYNLREWRHFFKLRTSAAAHPQMREIARPLLKAFQAQIPVVFDDIIF